MKPEPTQLSLEVITSEEDVAVYVKLTGFADVEAADKYADYLVDALPLMLFESETSH
jgi:hypothetical protein